MAQHIVQHQKANAHQHVSYAFHSRISG